MDDASALRYLKVMGFIARVVRLAGVLVLAGCGKTGTDAGNVGGSGGVGAVTNPNLLGTGELGVCTVQGWCWQSPAPVGDLFNAISDDGRYAVGENGIVFQWPDRYLPPAGGETLFFVQTAGNTVWAGGFGLWRYDGAEWTQESTESVAGLSAAPSGDVWALLGGAVQRRHAGAWALEQPAAVLERNLRLLDLIVVGDDTLWVLATSFVSPKGMPEGGELTLFEFKAGVWNERASSVKDGGNAWRFLRVGSKVHVHLRGGAQGVYSPADDWSLVAKEPGSEEISDARCRALVPVQGEGALCAAPSGGLSLIRPAEAPTGEVSEPLGPALFGTVPTPVWARAHAAWGTGPSDVWRTPLEHFDGLKWTSYLDAAPENFRAAGIDGSATDNVWFHGDREIVRYDGTTFHPVPLPDDGPEPQFVSAIHTLGANDTWAVRGEPASVKVIHFNGADWQDTLTVDDPSYAYARAAFAGGGSEPLWAAVGHGLYRREGDTWQRVITSDGYSLTDLAVDGADVWVLAQDSVNQLVDGALVPRGRHSGGLENIALTEEHVWHFSGSHARTLPR